jgi:hypothetical protein
MLMAHPKKPNLMRRVSRIYLTAANPGKLAALRAFLLLYVNIVNYFIAFFWTTKNFSAALAERGQASERNRAFAKRAPSQKDALDAAESGHPRQPICDD